jgi:prepilin-type N-terminal cleavage/methylation domain-containing protein
MKTSKPMNLDSVKTQCERAHSARGFTLMELLVATVIFVAVAGTAFSLFGQHATIAAQQQNLSGVNIGLRNAMTQMEMDLSGAGGNLLASISGIANPPQPFYFSVLINNNVAGVAAACAPNTTNWSYPISSACFDSLTLLSPNNSIVKQCSAGQSPVLVMAVAEPVSTSTTTQADDPVNTANNATDAGCFKNGDEVLVVRIPVNTVADNGAQFTCDVNGKNFNFCLNVVTLTADATTNAGGHVQFSHKTAGAGNDPLGIIYTPSGQTNFTNALNNSFLVGAYIINLGTASSAVTYAVMANPSNANDPQLVRCPGMSCTTANAQVVTDQIIGFKVGADLWNRDTNATGGDDLANYNYNAAKYCSDSVVVSLSPFTPVDCTQNPPAIYDPYDFTLVRAVRVSLIGRTQPYTDKTFTSLIKNGFDNGPYLVQQAATVVDLRNLSNVDSTN